MSGTLYLDAQRFHDLQVGARRLLFHIPTSALFELDAVGAAVLDLVKAQPRLGEADVKAWFAAPGSTVAGHGVAEVAETLHDLRALEVLRERADSPPAPALEVREFPLSTLVLNVTSGCNLSCSYCYKEDLAAPAKARRMDFETARRGVDLLFAEGAARERVSLVFFGGEPLTNLPLIEAVVDYAERRGAELGKGVDFSLTTNATLLSEAIVDYFDAHRFGISVSIDGPPGIHDRRRRTIGGFGTYEVVAAKSRMLLARYRSRPVGARVTLSHGVTDVVGIHRHLKRELGFAEVGFAPVTAGQADALALSGEELWQVFAGMKRLGEAALAAALEHRNFGFSNLNQLLADLHEGRQKALPCGAGLGLLAVDSDGEFRLCHRFSGSALPSFGNVSDGIARARLRAFLEAAAARPDCAGCRIRGLCAGGCYHEAYTRFADPLAPTTHYCALLRDWIDFGIETYVALLEKAPAFLGQYARRTLP